MTRVKPAKHSWKGEKPRRTYPARRLPLPKVAPYVPPQVHASNCLCAACMTAGQHRADYDKAKALQELL